MATFLAGLNTVDRVLDWGSEALSEVEVCVSVLAGLYTAAQVHETVDWGLVPRLDALVDMLPDNVSFVSSADLRHGQRTVLNRLRGSIMTTTAVDFAALFLARMRDSAVWGRAFEGLLDLGVWGGLHTQITNKVLHSSIHSARPVAAAPLAAALILNVLGPLVPGLGDGESVAEFLSEVCCVSLERVEAAQAALQ